MKTAVVTDGKYRASLAAVRALGEAGFRVVVTQTRAEATVTPASSPALTAARQFLQLLWSVRAIMSMPFSRDMFTILLGVMSLSPQGDRQEWMWRS